MKSLYSPGCHLKQVSEPTYPAAHAIPAQRNKPRQIPISIRLLFMVTSLKVYEKNVEVHSHSKTSTLRYCKLRFAKECYIIRWEWNRTPFLFYLELKSLGLRERLPLLSFYGVQREHIMRLERDNEPIISKNRLENKFHSMHKIVNHILYLFITSSPPNYVTIQRDTKYSLNLGLWLFSSASDVHKQPGEL